MTNGRDRDRWGGEGKSALGLCIALGAGLGAALGVALDTMPVGLAVGVGLGVALGAGLDARRRKPKAKRDGRSGDGAEAGPFFVGDAGRDKSHADNGSDGGSDGGGGDGGGGGGD